MMVNANENIFQVFFRKMSFCWIKVLYTTSKQIVGPPEQAHRQKDQVAKHDEIKQKQVNCLKRPAFLSLGPLGKVCVKKGN